MFQKLTQNAMMQRKNCGRGSTTYMTSVGLNTPPCYELFIINPYPADFNTKQSAHFKSS